VYCGIVKIALTILGAFVDTLNQDVYTPMINCSMYDDCMGTLFCYKLVEGRSNQYFEIMNKHVSE